MYEYLWSSMGTGLLEAMESISLPVMNLRVQKDGIGCLINGK